MEIVWGNAEALLLWNEGVREKPESIALEELDAVRSANAARVKRIRRACG